MHGFALLTGVYSWLESMCRVYRLESNHLVQLGPVGVKKDGLRAFSMPFLIRPLIQVGGGDDVPRKPRRGYPDVKPGINAGPRKHLD